jgi:acetyl-CoA acetyltransferase
MMLWRATATAPAITGIGQSEVGRRLARTALDLTVDASRRAIDDAGLEVGQIDGVSTWPGRYSPTPGFSGVGVDEVQDALGLDLSWFSGGPESAGQLGAVVNAAAAVRAGLARRILCFRTVTESSAATDARRAGVVGSAAGRVPPGPFHMLAPHGAMSATTWVALYARRAMHEHGLTRAQLGSLVCAQRQHAAGNPNAIYRERITLDDYLRARLIAEPLGMLDCDIPCDGSTAVIVSKVDDEAARWPPIRIDAIGSARAPRRGWLVGPDLGRMAAHDAAAGMWRCTSLRPENVDVAELYDGFSFLVLVWLEALGFCKAGGGGRFVEDGRRIALDGELPLNTGGGQLSGGRLHGFGHLHEACVQLWGRGGDRQAAKPVRTAVAAAGGGPLGGCLLLVRD